MPTFEEIYARHAAEYESLVSREDHQGNIARTLAELHPLAGITAVDMGAGTGRLTGLLAPAARQVLAFDLSPHMIGAARSRLRQHANLQFSVADNRALPLPNESVDLTVEGWSFGHATEWFAGRWQSETRKAISEMFRILKPGGVGVLLETMGTGSETAAPPNLALAALYGWLETEQGFQHRNIRTDYAFAHVDEAVQIAGFFFGGEMADTIKRNNWRIVPEWTGVWWKTKE